MRGSDDQSILDVVIADNNFETLEAAVLAAGLDDALRGEGPFTVFAPNDAAFAEAFTEDELQDLLRPENQEKLANVLQYHVVEGKLMAEDLLIMQLPQKTQTLNGSSLSVAEDNQTVKVDDANVVVPDIVASNGIIHIIDDVLMPSQEQDF